jgi:hypothetical protein
MPVTASAMRISAGRPTWVSAMMMSTPCRRQRIHVFLQRFDLLGWKITLSPGEEISIVSVVSAETMPTWMPFTSSISVSPTRPFSAGSLR